MKKNSNLFLNNSFNNQGKPTNKDNSKMRIKIKNSQVNFSDMEKCNIHIINPKYTE